MEKTPGRLLRLAALAQVAALAAAGACATPPEGSATSPRQAFGAVRRVALVRRADERRTARPRDVLDALRESLAQRGVEVRTIEIGARPRGEDAALARLEDEARLRAEDAASRRGPPRAERLGAGGIVERLGVDVVAFTFRYDVRAPPPRTPGGFGPPGGFADPRVDLRPAGAIALVGRDGTFLPLGWGPGVDPTEPEAAETPVEAVEQALRALLGEPERG